MNQQKADEIIDAVLERIEITGGNYDDAYSYISTPDRNELITIIIDIVGE